VIRDAIVKSLEANHLAGYAGDVWYRQLAPADHPWRRMPNNGMTFWSAGLMDVRLVRNTSLCKAARSPCTVLFQAAAALVLRQSR
jgi:lactate dehydrogenase-like 2-hydroxyacid dehydrogenase